MAELGDDAPQMHAEIGAYAKQKGIHQLFSFGKLSKLASAEFGTNGQHFDALEGLLDGLLGGLKNDVTVLVKGSRFMKMERVVNGIIKNKKHEGAH
jgi:UDP-N-acetylmuramyl pentapeptide synthase